MLTEAITRAVVVQIFMYIWYSFVSLFIEAKMISWIIANIVTVHDVSTPVVIRFDVTMSRYLSGFLIAMYLSIVINTRWPNVAKECPAKVRKLTFSKALQDVPVFKIRCSSAAIRIGWPTSPVKRSAPAKHPKSIVDLDRRSWCLVTTAKMTRAFNSTVGTTETKLMLVTTTRCLYEPLVKYFLCQT